MANDNNKINKLVLDDDDPTAELELLPVLLPEVIESELAANTSGLQTDVDERVDVSISELQSDLESSAETISRLQFDIEHLHAKWLGLDTEISVREEIAKDLNREITDLRESLTRKDNLLKDRKETIKSLKAEIRERAEEQQMLQDTVIDLREQIEIATEYETLPHVDAVQEANTEQEQKILQLEQDNATLSKMLEVNEVETAQNNRRLLEQEGQLASNAVLIKELRAQFVRSEEYADSLRRQFQDAQAVWQAATVNDENLQRSLDFANEKIAGLGSDLASAVDDNVALKQELEGLRDAHAEEVRILRFELGEAQETIAESSIVTEQLSSNLVETHSYTAELEKKLDESEASNNARIEELERENVKLLAEIKELKEKLEIKGQAVHSLIAELTKKNEQIDSIGQIEDVIQEIDNRMSERIDERSAGEKERMTRVLIGSVEGQELRFPLFKNRLTIGRTEQNDIQLKAPYISRRHAVIVTERDITRVIDWGSKNGVFVNSRQVNEHFLQNGDIVAIGTAKFRYEERPKREG